jgi:hypothetical protein
LLDLGELVVGEVRRHSHKVTSTTCF